MIWRAPWTMKPGLIVMAILLANASINNSSKTLQQAADMQVGTLKDKQTRMALLEANKKAALAAWQAIPKHEHVSKARLYSAAQALREVTQSAYDECHKGWSGNTRGPKCEGIEAQRAAQAAKVDALSRDKDLTDQEDELRQTFTIIDSKLQAEGAKVDDDLSKVKAAPFPQLLANIHVISQEVAEGASKDQPTLDALTMEFQAWFGAPASVGLVFWIFGLFTGTTTEADKRVAEHMPEIAKGAVESLAAALPNVPLTAVPAASDDTAEAASVERDYIYSQMEPDHSPEAVLGIVGQEMPEILKTPKTKRQIIARAALDNDPDASYERKARRKVASPDSVQLWHKERCTDRDGRALWQKELYDDFVAWCEKMNLKAIKQEAFGKVLREELDISFEKAPSNRYRYSGIGLRPNLRIVAA